MWYNFPNMSEGIRIETVEEFFFPAPIRDAQGNILPAPAVAQQKQAEITGPWHVSHPNTPHEKSLISMGPRVKDGVEGYSVRKEIIYKP